MIDVLDAYIFAIVFVDAVLANYLAWGVLSQQKGFYSQLGKLVGFELTRKQALYYLLASFVVGIVILLFPHF